MLDLNNYSYIMLNLYWNQRKMQEKYIFQTVPEHEKHRLSRAFVTPIRFNLTPKMVTWYWSADTLFWQVSIWP